MCENEATSMEPFQQYLTETFLEDSKRMVPKLVRLKPITAIPTA